MAPATSPKTTTRELRANLRETLAQAAKGKEIVVTLRGKPYVRIVPVAGEDAPGRYPLRTWYVLRQGSNGVTALTPAEAAAATVSFVADTDDPAMRVKQLGDLFSQGPTAGLGLWYHSEPSFFEALGEALSWPGETRHL